MKPRIISIILLVLIGMALIATPALAITAPDSITMVRYGAFYNVMEASDMYFALEANIVYASLPTDYLASEAFFFEVLDTDGATVLASTTISDYGDRPVGIYLSAAEVTTKGIAVGDALQYRIVSNPIITFTPTTVTPPVVVLTATNYENQELGVTTDNIPTNNPLRNILISMVTHMQTTDTPTDPYYTLAEGYKYITDAGAALFLAGMPNLLYACPIAFQTSLQPIGGDTPAKTGAYADSLTILNKWGQTTDRGFAALGSYLGVSKAVAGSLVLFVLVIAFAVYIYQRTQSGIVILLAVATTPLIGAYMGLVNLAIAFILVIAVVVLLGYYFLSRGAL